MFYSLHHWYVLFIAEPHFCPAPCHEGPCPPCEKSRLVWCRCGRGNTRVDCQNLETAGQFVCDKPCNKMKSCGRHRCNNRCCVVSLFIIVSHVCFLSYHSLSFPHSLVQLQWYKCSNLHAIYSSGSNLHAIYSLYSSGSNLHAIYSIYSSGSNLHAIYSIYSSGSTLHAIYSIYSSGSTLHAIYSIYSSGSNLHAILLYYDIPLG